MASGTLSREDEAAFEGAGTVLMDAQRFSEDALRAGGSFVESSAKGVAMWWATTPFAAMGDALSGGSDQGDQAAEEKHAHAVCTFEPPPNQFVVYCSGSYLERYGYTEAWHADGQHRIVYLHRDDAFERSLLEP